MDGPVGDQLVAVLSTAARLDPQALRNGTHLEALLADLAPQMASSLRAACAAAANANAAHWLTASPPYPEDQVAGWLQAEHPHLPAADAARVVAAFAVVTGARPASSPERPVGGDPYQKSGANGRGAPDLPQPETAPAGPPSFDSTPREPVTPTWRRNRWLIVAVVTAVLAGAGITIAVRLRSGGSGGTHVAITPPRDVRVIPAASQGVTVSWRAVPGAVEYHIRDRTGQLPLRTVHGTDYTFAQAASHSHRFVVQAMDSSNDVSSPSKEAVWTARTPVALTAPTGIRASRRDFDIVLTWDAVRGATGYRVRNLIASGDAMTTDTASMTVPNAVYADHRFVVTATAGARTSPDSSPIDVPAAHELSPAQQTLAYLMPANVAQPGSCQASSTPGTVAAIQCTPAGVTSDGPSALFARQVAQGQLQTFERQFYGPTFAHSGQPCRDPLPPGGISIPWTEPGQSGDLGELFCFITVKGGYDGLAWSYDQDNVVIQVAGLPPTTTFDGLEAWWGSHHTGSLRH